MEQLPPEVIIHYALNLDFESLVSFCQTCKYINAVCDTEYFWRKKTLRDICGSEDCEHAILEKPKNFTWKYHYHVWHELPILGSTAPNNIMFIHQPMNWAYPVWKKKPCLLFEPKELEQIVNKLRKILPHMDLATPDEEMWQYCEAIKKGLTYLGHFLPQCK